MPPRVTLISPEGESTDVAADDTELWRARGFHTEDEWARQNRVGVDARRDQASRVEALGQGIARGATFGLSDVLQRAVGGEDARIRLEQLRESRPGFSTAGEIGGSFLAPGVGELGATVRGAGGFTRGVAAGAAEGALLGAGQGVSEAALSDDPLTLEHVASTISSNALFGAGAGGVAGAATGALEKGLTKAKGALDEAAAKGIGSESAAVSPELAELDAKGLRAAKDAELTRIEGERVPQRKQLADDISAFRRELKEDRKLFLATKGIKETALPEGMEGALKIQEIGKISLDTDRQLDRLMRNPIRLAEKPESALGALQQQESVLLQMQKREPTLRAMFAADESGARVAALDAVPEALERNRAMQQRIRALTEDAKSPRLSAIDNARDALSAPAPAESFGVKMLKGATFGKVSAIVGMTPLAPLAHVAGAKAADAIGNMLSGRLAAASAEAAARTSNAIDTFIGVVQKATPIAPVVATKVLAAKRYAAGTDGEVTRTNDRERLADLYAKRSAEVRSQTAYNAMGVPEMRPDARAAMAAKLDPIRHLSPVVADRLETLAAARMEFLSSKLPRRPDLPIPPGAPDLWHPSDMQMRQWARYAEAADNPGGVEERLAAGTVTPEDAEAYKTLYPERYAAVQNALMSAIPKMTKPLSYQKRIALSIFSGAPLDPAMNPVVLKVLQGQFDEPGTEGGTQAPMVNPQFGSVKKSVDGPTPGQTRASGQETQ